MNRRIAAIVVAAGEGRRMGEEVPKQFLEVANRPIFANALLPFEAHQDVTDITLVLPAEYTKDSLEWLRQDFGLEKVIAVAPGGVYRRESVRAGLDASSGGEPWPEGALIAVHDGVRPLLSLELLTRVIEAAVETGAAVPVLPVKDTVAEADSSGQWGGVADRSRYRLVQTPQIFRADWLEEAHQNVPPIEATDDAQMVHARGYPVRMVSGDVMNIKITDPFDLEMVRYLVAGGML